MESLPTGGIQPPVASTRVRVPASSANLGPGFDALGLALGLYDEIEVRLRPGGLSVEVTGEGAGTVSRGRDNLVVRAIDAAFGAMGVRPGGLAVTCRNSIPHGRGLGSSSAAIVGGIVAARALAQGGRDRLPDDEALTLATALEGHPDNVAACLLGGLTIAWTEPFGAYGERPRAVRLEPAPVLTAVAFVPRQPVPTERARGLLPPSVPHSDAARNAGRAALLVEALTRQPALLLPATQDWLHQRYREPAMPDSLALVAALRDSGIAAFVSGAGPTVLAITAEGDARIGSDRAEAAEQRGFASRQVPLVTTGAQVIAQGNIDR